MKIEKVLTPEDQLFNEILINHEINPNEYKKFLIEADADIIKIKNKKYLFFEFMYNEKYYFLLETKNKNVKKILTDFVNNSGKFPILNTWFDFRRTENAVAYRGGSGYYYNIFNINSLINNIKKSE